MDIFFLLCKSITVNMIFYVKRFVSGTTGLFILGSIIFGPQILTVDSMSEILVFFYFFELS